MYGHNVSIEILNLNEIRPYLFLMIIEVSIAAAQVSSKEET